jgi:hypothetical protein
MENPQELSNIFKFDLSVLTSLILLIGPMAMFKIQLKD